MSATVLETLDWVSPLEVLPEYNEPVLAFGSPVWDRTAPRQLVVVRSHTDHTGEHYRLFGAFMTTADEAARAEVEVLQWRRLPDSPARLLAPEGEAAE